MYTVEKKPFTDKFPFLYLIQTNAYVISTTNEERALRVLHCLNNEQQLDRAFISKLLVNGFSVIPIQ